MKKIWNRKTIASLLIIASSLITVHIIQAAFASEPGTDSDPLVSQSYVDQKVGSLSAKNQELMNKIDELTKTVSELAAKSEEYKHQNEEYELQIKEMEGRLTGIEKYGMFVALELTEGQKLMTGASAEIILRGGNAKAIGGDGGGLSDITSGTGADINTNQEVPLNHLLLVSRDDGRGIKIVSKKAWVLVKGPYTIE
ncbi:MAG: hypothetical protein BWY74_01082 [Firmicutes bacterium ADurb.Bin419]|nr:MAG: hypothetical protein BWY74_01082 [Firmicutes bacterium ADurb.Bin419]